MERREVASETNAVRVSSVVSCQLKVEFGSHLLFLLGSVKGMLCLCMEYVGVIFIHLYYIQTLT